MTTKYCRYGEGCWFREDCAEYHPLWHWQLWQQLRQQEEVAMREKKRETAPSWELTWRSIVEMVTGPEPVLSGPVALVLAAMVGPSRVPSARQMFRVLRRLLPSTCAGARC